MNPEYIDDDDDDHDHGHGRYYGNNGLCATHDDGDSTPGSGGLISILVLLILLASAVKILSLLFR